MIWTAFISATTVIILEALHYASPPFSYGVAVGFIAAMALCCFSDEPASPSEKGDGHG